MVRETHTVKELPESERPYEKFMQAGPEALSDAELLAVIIRSGTSGRKSIDVSRELLSGGSQNLLNIYETSFEDMMGIRGIGKVKAIQLKCVGELAKRIASARYAGHVRMNNPQSIADYYMERVRHETREQLWLLSFDSNCQLLGDALVSIGGASSAYASPREIFLSALKKGAIQIVLLHNHPSGNPEPSEEDDQVTEQIAACGTILGIPLIDHIIIGDCSFYSYHQHQRILL